MPLEIRELNIRVNVGKQTEDAQQTSEQAQQSGGKADDGDTIKQCVEEVMDLLNKQKER